MEQLISFLNLDHTIWIQMAIFIFIYITLSSLVFSPLLAIFTERSARLEGDTKWAKELQEKAEANETLYRSALATERNAAKLKMEEALREARIKEQNVVQEARKKADADVDAHKAVLSEDRQKISRTLETDVEGLSLVVADRITRRVG